MRKYEKEWNADKNRRTSMCTTPEANSPTAAEMRVTCDERIDVAPDARTPSA
jgi:hypothetical protein